MSPEPGNDVAIVPCPVGLRAAALRLVFSDFRDELRDYQVDLLLGEAHDDPSALAGLWVALTKVASGEDLLRGAMLLRHLPGRAALLWPPRLAASESPLLTHQLLAAIDRILRPLDVRILQALLPTGALADEALLVSVGFEHIADLNYLACAEAEFPVIAPSGELSFEPVDPERLDRLAAIIERTYLGTLDCPRMNYLRETADVLAGFRAVGTFDSARWLVARSAAADVGCLLLADHAQFEHWELVYMGLAPEVRGRGLGRHMVRHAQWLARRAGRRRMVVSVDAANRPACDMYLAAGFTIWDERRVMIRVIDPTGA